MKRCQKCSRTFPDESQKFCTFDGGLLMVEQPAPPIAAPFDPNVTVRATSTDLVFPPEATNPSEATTSVQLPDLSATIASFGSGTFYEPATGPTGKNTSSDLTPPDAPPTVEPLVAPPQYQQTASPLPPPDQQTASQPPPPPYQQTSSQLPPPASQQTSSQLPPPPNQGTASPLPPPDQQTASQPLPAPQPTAPKKKKSVLVWVLAVFVILIFLGGAGGAAGFYFLWYKPRLEAKHKPRRVAEPTPDNTNTDSNTNTNSNSASANANNTANTNATAREKPAPFNPPGGAVKFANSKANLDGDLADHYVDFSFYYPGSWKKDSNAGVRGATSFAKIDRPFTDNTGEYVKERVVFKWYPSKGSYDADVPVFSDNAKQITKGLPNYEEVSSGEITLNTYKAYEVRFKGVFNNTGKGDLPYWGRVILLPSQSENGKSGVAIVMLATSLAADVQGVDDVGVKGELPLILQSFRFGPSS